MKLEKITSTEPSKRAAEGVTNLIKMNDRLVGDRSVVRCILVKAKEAEAEKAHKECSGPQ